MMLTMLYSAGTADGGLADLLGVIDFIRYREWSFLVSLPPPPLPHPLTLATEPTSQQPLVLMHSCLPYLPV